MVCFSNIIRLYFQLVADATPMKRRKLNPEGESFEATKTMKTETTMARSTFNDLSVEVWHEIAVYLAPSDKAALALTCRSSLTCFGSEVIKTLNLPSQRVERLKLLFRLLYQFPKHYLCPECCMYHLGSNEAKFEPADIVLSAFSNKDYILKWSIMSTIAEDLRTAKCTPQQAQERLGFPCMIAIVDGRCMISHTATAPLTVRLLQLGTYDQFRACKHIPTSGSLVEEAAKVIAAAPRPWEPLQAYLYESAIFRCPYCPTEFTIFTKDIAEDAQIPHTGARFKMCLNRIIDLGRLRSPHDRKWAALARSRYAGVVETEPYDIGGNERISEPFYAIKAWGLPSDDPVLPLRD